MNLLEEFVLADLTLLLLLKEVNHGEEINEG